MITINKFKISNDRKSFDLKFEVDSSASPSFAPEMRASKLTLYTEETYGTNNGVDLTSLLSQSSVSEDLTITRSQANTSFDGLVILRIEQGIPSSSTSYPSALIATFSLTRLYGVTAKLLSNVNLSCLNCNDNFQNALLLDLYIQGIVNALQLGRFQDAIGFIKKINIYEEFNCAECDQLMPVVSTASNIVSVGVLDCVLNLED